MRLREILLERLTSTIYHATLFRKGIGIMRDNQFRLSEVKFTGLRYTEKEKKKYPYYLSLARTMNSGYIKEILGASVGIVFELDGDKLSNNFKGKAVDWYGEMGYKGKRKSSLGISMSRDEEEELDKEEFFRHFEHEDRLYSSKPILSNFDKYIKSVHVEKPSSGEVKQVVDELKSLGKSYPIYLYSNHRDMLLRNTKKAEKI